MASFDRFHRQVGRDELTDGIHEFNRQAFEVLTSPEQPKTRPVQFRDLFATLYERLGIDVATTQFSDLAGRPQYLVGDHRPLAELPG